MIRNINTLVCRMLAAALVLFGLWVMVKDGCGGTNNLEIVSGEWHIKSQTTYKDLRIDKLTIGTLTIATNITVCTNCVALKAEVERLKAELELLRTQKVIPRMYYFPTNYILSLSKDPN